MITLSPPGIDEYAMAKSEPMGEFLDELMKETMASMSNWAMLTGHLEGRFLKLLVSISQAKYILEIGMFTGYSALCMAEALPPEGRITSLEIDANVIAFAKRYFDKSGFGHKINVMHGPALDSLRSIKGPFDMVFIDADKVNYPQYYETVLPMIKTGGIIVIDNVLWSGKVLNPQTEDDKAIVALNNMIAEDERVDRVLLTIRDGVFLLRKR